MYIYLNLLMLFLIAYSVSELCSVGTCFINNFFYNFNLNYAAISLWFGNELRGGTTLCLPQSQIVAVTIVLISFVLINDNIMF